jgi:GR25 family glycosyltransferase involved in LPS biosynthesis
MTAIEEYFGHIIVINLERRPDRLAFVEQEMEQLGITNWQRFNAIDLPGDENTGCTMSHGAVLQMVVENHWPRALILEDDFQSRLEDTQERFERMVQDVPKDWFMLYLSGHYAEKPRKRISFSVIQMGRMKTTTSYGITLESAKELAPHIHGIGPIDELYGGWHVSEPCFIFQPRLFIQREGWSDLQHAHMSNEGCMTDATHENMLP